MRVNGRFDFVARRLVSYGESEFRNQLGRLGTN
jgi:hypothetical protein